MLSTMFDITPTVTTMEQAEIVTQTILARFVREKMKGEWMSLFVGKTKHA